MNNYDLYAGVYFVPSSIAPLTTNSLNSKIVSTNQSACSEMLGSLLMLSCTLSAKVEPTDEGSFIPVVLMMSREFSPGLLNVVSDT